MADLVSPPTAYIWTAQGWLYVGGIDLHSRRLVGWSMSSSMPAQLVTDALIMAIWRRGNPDSLLDHSDRKWIEASSRRLDSHSDGPFGRLVPLGALATQDGPVFAPGELEGLSRPEYQGHERAALAGLLLALPLGLQARTNAATRS